MDNGAEAQRLSITHLPNYSITNFVSDSHFRGDAFGHEGLNHVSFFHVIEIGDVDAAFHAIAHFAGVVFKALERADPAFVDLHAVAHQAHVGIALDYAIQHVAAGDGACL